MKSNYALDIPNFVVSGLPDYVKENKELIVDQIALQSPTIDRIAIMPDVKKKATLNFLDTTTAIQNGAGCGFSPAGSVSLSDRDIETVLLKKDIRICVDNLIGKWPEYLVRIPEDRRQDLPFEAFILASIIEETNEQMEELVWQGDTESGTSSLTWFDGFLEIAKDEAGVTDVNIASGSTAWSAIRQVIAGIPVALRKRALKIFVSPEFYTILSFETLDKNLYHHAGNEDVANNSFTFPGTKYEIVNTPGLSGTLKIFVSEYSNMFYATDIKDAHKMSKVGYNEENDYFYIKFRWNAGVQIAFPDRVVLGALVANPTAVDTPASIAEALGDIETAVGTVKTSVDSVKTSVDSVKTSIDTGNGSLANIKTSVDSVKSSIDTGNGSLADIDTAVTGMNADDKVFKTQEQS